MVAVFGMPLAMFGLLLFADAVQIPFMNEGPGMDIHAVDIAAASGGSNSYNVSLLVHNGPEDIVNQASGYLTTMRVRLSSSGDLRVNKAYPFCEYVTGGCPVRANDTFTVSFKADLGKPLRKMTMTFLTVDFAAGNRFLGTLNVQFTPELSRGLEISIGIALPLGLLIVSAVKYLMVVLLDPEPVASWNPLISRQASGANELATIASISDILQYLQFIALGLLVDVQYPVYFQSLMARFSWLLGIFSNNWISKLSPAQAEKDGIIIPAGSTQLESVLFFTELSTIADLWPAGALSLIICLSIVGMCALVSYWKSFYRRIYVLSALLHYWFAVSSLPVLLVIFTSFDYMQMYQPDSNEVPFRPFSFGLTPPFYTINTNPGVIFSMAFVLGAWLCLACYTLFSMARAKYKGYLSLENLILWGRFYNASHNDVFYHLYQVLLTVLLACTFSVLSRHGLAQCIILLVTQLLNLITVSGTRPRGLTTVGFVLILIPKTLQIVVCCLLFTLLPTVLQERPRMMSDGVTDQVVYAIMGLHALVLFYFFLIAIACMCITTWRHFNLRPTSPQPPLEHYGQENRLPSHMYYRAPKNQPMDDDTSKDEEDLIRKNYAVREVDFVYGINGAPNFIDKMFKPAPTAQFGSSNDLSLSPVAIHPPPLEQEAPTHIQVERQHNKRPLPARGWFKKRETAQPAKESGFEVLRP